MFNLKAIRQSKKLTQKDIANALGIQQGTVADWERGRINPKLDTIFLLLDYLNVTPNELLSYTDPNIVKNFNQSGSNNDLNDYAKELLNNFQKLTPKNQIKLIAFSQELVELEETKNNKKGMDELSTSQIS